MALEQTSPPELVGNALREGLEDEGRSARSFQFAFPLYYLPVANLRADAGVSCRVAGWQFLGVDLAGKALAGEVSSARDGGYDTVLVQGSAVEEALKASEEIRSLPPAQENTVYQLRKLRIPAIRIEAIWLKASPFDEIAGDADLVYAYFTFQASLKRKVLAMPDFLKIARGLAEKEAQFDTSPRRNTGAREGQR